MLESKILTDFFDSLNMRDLEQMGVLLTEKSEFYFPKARPMVGKERILKFFRILFRQYPRLSFKVLRIITEGQKAAVHWINKGISRRGDPYDNEGVTIFESEIDGKIYYMSDFFKDTEKF